MRSDLFKWLVKLSLSVGATVTVLYFATVEFFIFLTKSNTLPSSIIKLVTDSLIKDINHTFSIFMTSTILFGFVYEKWLWKLNKYGSVPILKREYRGNIHCKYDESIRAVGIKVKQTLLTLKVTLITDESKSNSITAEIVQDPSLQLIYTYLNVPKQSVRDRSEIHYGTTIVTIDDECKKLSGHYFTDRNTLGDIHLESV